MGSSGFPTLVPQAGTPLPLDRVLRVEFPGCIGTMRVCDSLGPSRRARLPSLDDTLRRACRFAPVGPRRPTAGQGFVIRSPRPEIIRKETSSASQVPGKPRLLLCHVLRLRQDCTPLTMSVRQHGPRKGYGEGSHIETFEAPSHGLEAGCLRFAGWITPPPRKTRFPVLARLSGAGLVTRRVSMKGF